MTRTLRLTPELVARLPPRVDERGPIRWDVPDAWYGEAAAQIVSRLPEDGALWIFAIGSLIWKPRFPVAETRPARRPRLAPAPSASAPTPAYRGNPAAPGLMLVARPRRPVPRPGDADGPHRPRGLARSPPPAGAADPDAPDAL